MSQAEKPNTMSRLTRRNALAGLTTPSRRGFLAVLSAGAASAVAPAAMAGIPAPVAETSGDLPASMAIPSPDAALLQLVDQYFAAHAEYRRLDAICDRAYRTLWAENPMPDVLLMRPEDEALGLYAAPASCTRPANWASPYLVDRLRNLKCRVMEHIQPPEGMEFYFGDGHAVRYIDPSAAAQVRAAEIIEAYDEWFPSQNQCPPGIRGTERKRDTASKLVDRLRRKIDRSRALTLAGLIAKAKVADCERCDDDPQFGDGTRTSMLRDLLRLGRAPS